MRRYHIFSHENGFYTLCRDWVREKERRNGKNGSIFLTHHYDKIVQILLSYFHFSSAAELSVRTTKKLSALESALLYYMLILTLLSWSRFCFFNFLAALLWCCFRSCCQELCQNRFLFIYLMQFMWLHYFSEKNLYFEYSNQLEYI